MKCGVSDGFFSSMGSILLIIHFLNISVSILNHPAIGVALGKPPLALFKKGDGNPSPRRQSEASAQMDSQVPG